MEEEIQAIKANWHRSTDKRTDKNDAKRKSKRCSGYDQTLHDIGLAEIGEWTPMQPTQNEGEVISILCRKIVM